MRALLQSSALRFFVAAVCCTIGSTTAASPSQRLVKSPAHRLQSIEPPPGWELSPSPPSSRLLATWTHREGARLTLAAEQTAGLDANQLFARSRSSLERQGWTIVKATPSVGKTAGSQRVAVEATLDKGKRSARQLYLIEEGFAYVLTMVNASEQTAARQRDLDETIASMRVGTDEN